MPGPDHRAAPPDTVPALAGRAIRAAAARLLPLLLAAALGTLAGCGAARTKADCDELLAEHKFQAVLNDCPNPYHRASAYLGLAGFDLDKLLNSTAAPGDVRSLLGLTPADITARRQYLEKAVTTVRPPDGNTQAFALLLAALLGLDTAAEEHLDANLDGTISQAEIDAAFTATYQVPRLLPLAPATISLSPTVPPTVVVTPVLQVVAVVAGRPYILVCDAADTPNVCGAAPAKTQVYDDPDGSGRLTPGITAGGPSGNASTVLAAIASATSVGLIVQLSDLSPPATFSADATLFLPGYLGAGQPQGPFKIGLGGYLSAMSTASGVLATGGGQPGGSTVTSYINALVAKFDNGGACKYRPPLDAYDTATLVGYLNAFAPIYAAAAGTFAHPVPAGASSTYFSTRNLVPVSIGPAVNAVNATLPKSLPVSIQLPDPNKGITYAFAGGTIPSYKFLYPTAPDLFPFDASHATPRVDQAFAAFVSQFEAIPIFAPSVAADGDLTFMEILCAGS